MAKQAKKKIGRPRKPNSERKRNNLTIRIRDALRDDLETSATANQRSMSEEAEARLERSVQIGAFAHEALALAYGPHTAGLALLIARAMNDTGKQCGFLKTSSLESSNDWMDVPYAYSQAAQAVRRILELAKPEGDDSPPGLFPPDHSLDGVEVAMGAGITNGLVAAVTEANAGTEIERWAAPLRELLGPIATRMLKARRRRLTQAIVSDASN